MNAAPHDSSTRERELVAPRDELHAYCYRMLGSVHDADDALQEVMLRPWRGLEAFEGRSSLRSWLYRIATNVCLNAIAAKPKRVLPIDYSEALEQGDVDALLAMLTADATWSMPPEPAWYRGHEIAAFLHEGPMRVRWGHAFTSANGQPAVACYAWDEDKERFLPRVLDVLTLRESQIAAVTAFVDPGIFASFGLPAQL